MRRIQNLENHDPREKDRTAHAKTYYNCIPRKSFCSRPATLKSGVEFSHLSHNERTEWGKNECPLWRCCLSAIWE